MKYEAVRQQVLNAILEARELGLIRGTSGNAALRDEEEPVVAITPSGISYQSLRAEEIAIVDLEGNWLEGPYKPSSETPMHIAVLRARPDVKATVHTHGKFSTLMAMGGTPLRAITPPHCEFAPVPVVPFGFPGSQELVQAVMNALGADGRGVLMQNHGMFCCGRNMKAAMDAAAYIEEMAELAYYAAQLGVSGALQEEDAERLKAWICKGQAV